MHKNYSEFQPRPHPELDIVHSEAAWVRPETILTSDEITRLSLPEWLERLNASRELNRKGQFDRDHEDGFLAETARAASEHLEWGLAFTRSLLQKGLVDHDVWSRILTAWEGCSFKPGEWRGLVGVMNDARLLAAQPSGVAEVIRGRGKQKDPKPTKPMLHSSLRLAEKLLPLSEEIPLRILSETDWLTQAINHPGGQLAEFLVTAIGELLGPNPQRGCGVPRSCRPLLNAMAAGTGKASAMGRVVLATSVHYFLWIGPEWTKANLIPLFDWDREALQAVQAWHGFLAWGRPSPALLEELTPSAVQLALHFDELGSEREHYGSFVARAAFSLPDDPLDKAWFQAFLAEANDDDRTQFAWQLGKFFEVLRPEQKAEIWRGWLRRYLERRAEFTPVPEGKEITELMSWSVNLPEQLSELVGHLEALPGSGASVDQLLWKLQQGELSGNPNLLARLVLTLLRHCEKIDPWEIPQVKFAIERLIDDGAEENLVRELIEEYLEHGGLDHAELLEKLQGRAVD